MKAYFSLAIGVCTFFPGSGREGLHCEGENFESLINGIFKGRET
jgi:hypothetical protein